jgi:hypothetical protein
MAQTRISIHTVAPVQARPRKKRGAREARTPSQNFQPYVDCPFLGATSPFASPWVTKAMLISLSLASPAL